MTDIEPIERAVATGAEVEPLRRPRRSAARPRRRVSVLGVAGELLITAGVLVLAFLGWQVWLNDIIVGNQLNNESLEQAREWQKLDGPQHPGTPDEPPVMTAPGHGERFALLIVPRFGSDYYRPIAEGVSTRTVLNKGWAGHYPSTQMPGEPGNFSIAAHRTSYGASFRHVDQLRPGDHIYVETQDGWYAYVFRNLEYVRPTGVGVLTPVPQVPGAVPGESYITLTSCNPLFSAAERIIAYGVFERFYPRADGAPEEIAHRSAEAAG